MTPGDLQDRLVTGASAGFGRSIVKEVLGRGGRVVATARDRASVADLESGCPDRALALPLDVTEQQQIGAAVQAAEARFGRIDVLVNNAAAVSEAVPSISPASSRSRDSPSAWRRRSRPSESAC